MTYDQNKKTLRQFQCRDYLWEIFEQMSAELECSTDYLINEAMRQYARSRNYGTRTPPPVGVQQPAPRADAGASTTIPPLGRPAVAPRAPIPSAPPAPRSSAPGPYPYGAPPSPAAPPTGARPTYPSRMGYPAPPGAYTPGTPSSSPPTYPPAPVQRPAYAPPGASAPPPLPMAGRPAPPVPSAGLPPLFVIFNGQKVPVQKEEFVVGRGSKTADLAIKDGNISRRHAAVVFQNGAWFMKDLGSTNGVEFGGHRIDSKRIEEGDVFQLCDYELRFTYR